MEKVFCSRCQYFYSRRIDKCLYPDNQKKHTNWRNEYTTPIRRPKYINKWNKCKWFTLSQERS